MALNSDSGWILKQAMFQKASTGEEVRNSLLDCLTMLLASHDYKMNENIKARRTVYKFGNSSTVKGKYKCRLNYTMIFNDGIQDIPIDGKQEEYAASKYSSEKKAAKIPGNRLRLWCTGDVWTLKWLENSEDHQKGDMESWSATDSTPVIVTTTFQPST